jgi:hypothetical protein
MTFRRVALAVLLCLTLMTGAPAPVAAQDSAQPRVVVAVIDSAVNPYHEFFHAGGSLYGEGAPSSVTPEVLAEFGIGSDNIIRLTRTGNFDADFAVDKAQWDAIADGQPYWFEGTNVIGISFGREDGERLRPEGSGNNPTSHGMGTTSAVLAANPEAIAVLVESPNGPLTEFGTKPAGETWSFTHPAVDIVTTSYGPPFSPPMGHHLRDSYTGVVTNGKLHFGAADNSPALSSIDATAGPWWSIGIAGYGEGSTETRERRSGSYPDFVGDFTQELPYCLRCVEGTSSVSGTSFATPRSAGTMSAVLLEARRTTGHLGGIATDGDAPSMVRTAEGDLTNWDLRRALEEGAFYPSTPLPVAALDYSWGAITPDPEKGVIAETLAHLGFGEPTRVKDADTCSVMTVNIEARQAYWNNHPRSEGFCTSADPYIRC